MASRYTDWFPPDVKPVHEGRYQRRFIDLEGDELETGDGIWKDGLWYLPDERLSLFQRCKWRGLRKPTVAAGVREDGK